MTELDSVEVFSTVPVSVCPPTLTVASVPIQKLVDLVAYTSQLRLSPIRPDTFELIGRELAPSHLLCKFVKYGEESLPAHGGEMVHGLQ